MNRDLLSWKNLSYLMALFTIFLTSGGIYLIVIEPGTMVSTGTGTSFLVRSYNSQTSTEFFVVFFITLGGMIGFFTLERALRRSFDIEGSKLKFVVGTIMLIISIFLLEYLLRVKLY
ncbi:MAG: hypothetical protein QFX35_00355 [Candidatus Verstraetearchaeota archaeon]|nr:hypothetical protein [Candidatus Verstraetearchaeota archaeon]